MRPGNPLRPDRSGEFIFWKGYGAAIRADAQHNVHFNRQRLRQPRPGRPLDGGVNVAAQLLQINKDIIKFGFDIFGGKQPAARKAGASGQGAIADKLDFISGQRLGQQPDIAALRRADAKNLVINVEDKLRQISAALAQNGQVRLALHRPVEIIFATVRAMRDIALKALRL